jgi:dTDP-4-amino-4,6-dideoxygalactose transaminase
VGCFSFYPGKNLGAFGDAGLAVTDDAAVADRLRLLREHGRRDHRTHEIVGFNSRMDPIHAAVLRVKLRRLDEWNARRRQAAGWYRELLPPSILDGVVEPAEADVHHLFPILAEDRDALAAGLGDAGIASGVHYAQTVPQTEAFGAREGEFPAAERRARVQLSLPIHPHLQRHDVERVAGAVTELLRAAAA